MNLVQRYQELVKRRQLAWHTYQAAERRYRETGLRRDQEAAEVAYDRFLAAQTAVILSPGPEAASDA